MLSFSGVSACQATGAAETQVEWLVTAQSFIIRFGRLSSTSVGAEAKVCVLSDELGGTWSALHAFCYGDWPYKDNNC